VDVISHDPHRKILLCSGPALLRQRPVKDRIVSGLDVAFQVPGHERGKLYVSSNWLNYPDSYSFSSALQVNGMRRVRQLIKAGLIVLTVTFGLTACNRNRSVEAARDERQPPAVTPAEQEFMIKANQANLADIDMARIAKQKTQNADLKDFANMIESDHTGALEDLADLMQNNGMSPSNVLSPDAKADIEKITALSGDEMDREFVNAMVADHHKAIGMFRDQLNIAQSPDVRKYAERVLAILEMHLEKAQKLQSKLFGGGKP
jgi:putative membrane protein